jgi:hypothetical protein
MARKSTTSRKTTSPLKKAAARKEARPAKKTAAKKASRPRKAAARPAGAPDGGVKVRMYRQGLGDCFLLTFPTGSERPFYMMIDCGVLLGTEKGGDRMKEVVQDIIETTEGQVDLLVATHQHWDHLSGFIQAEDLFARSNEDLPPGEPRKLKVGRLWLAWTEDPANRLANHIRAKQKRREQALRATVQSLHALSAEMEREEALRLGVQEPKKPKDKPQDEADRPLSLKVSMAATQVEDVLGFFGAAGSGSTEDALNIVRDCARTTRFCRPDDDPITLRQVPGVRFFVLGPPENEELIKRSDPSKRNSEVYEDAEHALNLDNAFFAAVLPGETPESVREVSLPFDRCYQIPVEKARQTRFFQRHYYEEDSEQPRYKDQAWRRIQADWTSMASQLALHLDNDTNNTSLALAIELVDSGKVLLFPADAQVGNWLSWADLSWTVDGREVNAEDLLRRTVLYKVGHHGSHNATLRDQGLEKMESGDLVALIPVHQEMAKKKKWSMPFPPLYNRLLEKTNGRVLRIDDEENIEDREAPDGISRSQWKAFQRSVEDTELYYEITIEG